MDPKAHRLPPNVRPIGYAVDISTHPARPDFEGVVVATIHLGEPCETIEMHARELEVRDVRLTVDTAHATHTSAAGFEIDAARELVIVRPGKRVGPGQATLTIHFRGKPNTSMHGLYLARDGAERAICTQCEATDARAIFPCFDEPELKATITWTVRTEGDVLALTNCPLLGVEEVDNQKIWRFQTSAPIASYLFALVVGDFEGTAATLAGTTPSRVFAMRGKLDQTRFAHELTARLMPWFERYFDVPYPFKKYDQIAVPGFDAGAMENVGLVLFRQNLLLMDPRAASWNQEKLIAKVIAHELAHMWFGNLVTMRWWDDLWLNEAFAEWMAHKAAHAIEPSYLVWNDFQADKNRALVDDALPTTHPIWSPVSTPSEALEMFDVITYQKGCAVMRMLETFLGEESFMRGLRAYMKEFAYKNAAGGDLWSHLERSSGQPVGALMRSWVEQPGFPIVEVSLEAGGRGPSPDPSPGGPAPREGDDAILVVAQRRFFSSPAASAEANAQLWSVPMVVRFEDDAGVHTHRFIFSERTRAEPLPAKGAVRWCCTNVEEIGFFRVQLKGRALDLILAQGPAKLSPVEQMGFIEDRWALVRNGTSTIEAFLPVLDAFASTRDHNVLRAIVDRLGTLDLLLEDSGDTAARTGLRRWIAAAITPQLDELGFTPRLQEPQNDVQRRALVIYALAVLGRVERVIDACVRYAAEEQKDPRAIDPNLSGTFVGVAARFGDEPRYETWLATYKARKAAGAPPQDCLRYLYTLAAFRPEALTRRTLAAVDDGTIPQEAVGAVVSQLLGARETQGLAWDHVRATWTALRARVGDMGVSRVVESVGALEAKRREEIVTFFRDNPPKGAERALARALETLDQRRELALRVTPGLVRHFTSS